jgi:FkbM family methyltransferase
MTTVSIEEANFIDRLVAGKYHVKMPHHLSLHERWDVWERERFASMESNLRPGDILFDIGAETGEMSAIYAQFVGAENMVLFESNPDNWQTIYATWQANGLAKPKATFCGLVSNRHTPDADFDTEQYAGWPKVAFTGRVFTHRAFRYIHEHANTTPQISIDEFVATREIIPRAITMDCEGGEIRILKGAVGTLEKHRPLCWASLHDDTALLNYNSTLQEVHDFMASMGYVGTLLADDHEAHWFYRSL